MPKWTPAQQAAIDDSSRNVIVSAAAGSGKTAVLVERVVRIITDKSNPVDVDKLLIVTFTNPAAAEMKSRISAKLQEKLRENLNDTHIQKQISLLPSAKICTIDSFCINLVRENFFKIGISQDFRILDETEAQIISDNALNAVLDEAFEEKDEDFTNLVNFLSNPKNDNALISSLKEVYTYIYALSDPFCWLEKVVELHNPEIPFKDSVWCDCVMQSLNESFELIFELFNSALDCITDDEAAQKCTEILESDRALFEKLQNTIRNDWDEGYNVVDNVKFAQLRVKNSGESSYFEQLKAIRNKYKDIFKDRIVSSFCQTSQQFKEDNEVIYPVLKMLCKIIKRYDEEYRKLKDEKNSYTFSDIEHFALSLLAEKNENGELFKSQLANELESSFYEILVDEYQDTNEAQDFLFSLLSNGSNRFMVGDIKQSIYRFRLAMPFIFNEKKNSYKPLSDASEEDDVKIILDKNFRSRDGICGYVNFLFSKFMSEKTGELEYNSEEYLNYGADYEKSNVPCASIKILDNVKSADMDAQEAEAISRLILAKIANKEQVKDKDGERNIRYGDFVILLRSTKRHIMNYNEILTKNGIPVVCENASNLIESNEIRMIISLLKVIDNPMQDIPLLAVMMSPLYGFTPDELTQIKLENDNVKTNLYTAVSNSENQKVKDFISELKMFSEISATMTVSSFIRYLCETKSIYAFASALGNAEQRCANINAFISFAQGFDSSDSIGLTSFMRLVSKVEEGDRGIDSPALVSNDENAVKIMSIHHSKGLEFPVVILAGANRRYNNSDLTKSVLLDPKYGVAIKYHNEDLLYKTETMQYYAMKSVSKNASISENLRVLYVAMTRAKEQFITYATYENVESKVNSLAVGIIDGNVNPAICRNYSCDADFILACALMHNDGKELRKLSEIPVKTSISDFDMDVEFVNNESEEIVEESQEDCKADKNILQTIKSRAEYKYDGTIYSAIPAKRNASELDESIKSSEFFASSKPAFLNDGGLTPGQKGTAMHSFMQFCDYKNCRENLEKEISRITENGYISKQEADSLDRNELSQFFESEFAKRLFSSDKIYREIKVTTFVPVSEFEDVDEKFSEEKILVRGISDCVFEENGELVLLDYKTDRVKTEEELLSRYSNQIGFYRKVIEKTLEKPVKEAVLYSFSLGKVCYY